MLTGSYLLNKIEDTKLKKGLTIQSKGRKKNVVNNLKARADTTTNI